MIDDDGQLFSLEQALTAETYYQTEGVFYEPFFVLEQKIASLARFHALSISTAGQFVVESQASLVIETGRKQSAELQDLHFSLTMADKEYFEQFVYASVLTQLFSIFETFLLEIIDLLKSELAIQEPVQKENIPLINRYIKWINHSAEAEFSISKETWSTLDILREIRNRFVHAQTKTIPEQMIQRFREHHDQAKSSGLSEHEHSVLLAFRTIGTTAKQVELAVLKRMQSE